MYAQKFSNQFVEAMEKRTATNVNWIMLFVRVPKVVANQSPKEMMVNAENVRIWLIIVLYHYYFFNNIETGILSLLVK